MIIKVIKRFRWKIDDYLKRTQVWFDAQRPVPPRHCRVIGGMATMPSRQQTLKRSLPSILRQVDRLYLYLDGYPEIPSFAAKEPKIVPITSDQYPGLRGAGKFIALAYEQEAGLFVGFDDDIYYPYNYIQALLDGLERHGEDCIVGFHASSLHQGLKSYQADRHVIYFGHALSECRRVHVLGSGTVAFHLDKFRFDARTWAYQNMSDLQLALEAQRQRLPMVCLKRKKDFLRSLDVTQTDSIYAALRKDDSVQTELAQQLLRGTW